MTCQQPGTGGGEKDPVQEFFAAHRAQVREEPADDLTWQRIREGHQRGGRANRGVWAGGLVAAAAALAIVVGPSLLPDADVPDLAGPEPSLTGPATSPTPDPGHPSSTAPTTDPVEKPRVVTTDVPEAGLPGDGRVTDLTTADPEPAQDTGVRYAVVMHECATSGWCSILATSEDAGLTWTPRADLEELGMVHQVLFTDHGRGWVWGDKAPTWATTDGGRTWTEVDTGDLQVVDLTVQGNQVLATTWDRGNCGTPPCHPASGSVIVTDPTDQGWADDVAADLGPVERAMISGTTAPRYVLARGESGHITSVLRFEDQQLESTAALSSCGPGPVAVTASAGATEHVWALCDDDRGLVLHESDTGGRTWTPSNRTVPSFVLGEDPPLLAATNPDHLVLVGEGNYSVTTDGGQTWSAEAFLPGADARPERLEVTQFGEIIAYPTPEQASADLAFWRSGDGGQTWEAVPLVR